MQPRQMMGFDSPGDQKVPVPVRNWSAMKLALWRSKTSWEIAARAALEIIERCEHVEGCPGAHIETEPCLSDRHSRDESDEEKLVLISKGCPDREMRMSALVVLNAARMFAPIDAKQLAREPYHAPSREFFSDVVAELSATQIENDTLREMLRTAGMEVPSPSPNETRVLPVRTPPKLSPAQAEELK